MVNHQLIQLHQLGGRTESSYPFRVKYLKYGLKCAARNYIIGVFLYKHQYHSVEFCKKNRKYNNTLETLTKSNHMSHCVFLINNHIRCLFSLHIFSIFWMCSVNFAAWQCLVRLNVTIGLLVIWSVFALFGTSFACLQKHYNTIINLTGSSVQIWLILNRYTHHIIYI